MNKKPKKKLDKRSFVTQAELSRRLGVSPVSICNRVKTGRFKTVKIDGKALINYKDAKRIFLLTMHGSKNPKVKKSNGKKQAADLLSSDLDVPHDLVDARLTLEKYKALKAKLEYEENSKKLVRFDEIKKTWMDIAANLQKSVIGIADRIGPLVAAETDMHSCTLLLRTELKQALQGIVDKHTEKV